MAVIFLHPPTEMSPSGGNIFNRQVIHQARQRRFALVPIEVAEATGHERVIGYLRQRHGQLILWDSLLMQRINQAARRYGRGRHALLLHFLPSLNPLLDADQRGSAQQMENLAIQAVQFLITTGRRLAQHLQDRFPQKPVFVCEPGVSMSFSAAEATASSRYDLDSVQLLTAANLLPAKGYTDLLCVLARLRHLNWRWHIAGSDSLDREYAARFWELADSGGMKDRITFHGVLDQHGVASLMSSADLFLSPSHYEAYGMAVAEAVAAGLPVLATRTGEADRLVRQGINGWLADVGDWTSFEQSLAVLIEDEAARRRMRGGPDLPPRSWEMAFEEFRSACGCMLGQR